MEQFKAWLFKADHDLRAAKKLAFDAEPILDAAVYHAQQSAEKALKAFLAFKKHSLEKTHDLDVLVQICGEYDGLFLEVIEQAQQLNPYSTLFRYPDVILEPDLHDVQAAIIAAELIMTFVIKRLGGAE